MFGQIWGNLLGMLRGLFKLFFRLVAVFLFLFLCVAAVIVFDGLNDEGQKADCALVTGHVEGTPGAPDLQLDRAVQLYNSGEFPVIIVGGSRVPVTTDVSAGAFSFTGHRTDDGAADMATYLESHGVPAKAIIEVHRAGTIPDTAREVVESMRSHQFQSVMIVADYYRMTRLKLVLGHEGVADIEKSHVGKLQKEDALNIGREVVALCDYVGRIYLLPEAEKAKEEAKVGLDKASVEAEKAKEKVDKSLSNMAK